jgi:hypothetical protein
VPGHLKHLQGGPGSVAVAVVPVGELVLRRLLEPGRLGQQLSQSTLLSLSLRPSTRSDVASSCQRAIAAWLCLYGAEWTGQLHMRHSTTCRTNEQTGVQRGEGSTRAGEHKQNSPLQPEQTRAIAHMQGRFATSCSDRPTTSPPSCSQLLVSAHFIWHQNPLSSRTNHTALSILLPILAATHEILD